MTLQRRKPLGRGKPLQRGTRLASVTPLRAGNGLQRGRPIRQVSSKRQAENRQRRAMIDALWPEQPECFVPWCPLLADDVHEPLTRARGGSITDPANARPLCRGHHDEITFRPESELGWAYDLGLLIHSWNADRTGAA